MMTDQELIDSLELFKTGAIAISTDGDFNVKEYKKLREIIVSAPRLKSILPDEIKYCRTPKEYQQKIRSLFDSYRERRAYITDEINKLISAVEDSSQDDFSGLEEYSNLKRIGNGGYGEVFLYHHNLLNLDFAIKFFSPVFVSNEEQKESEKRFFREAKILFSLHCDNIVQVYDASYYDGKPYIRMEYIAGFNLIELIEKHSIIPFDKTLIVIRDILKGLEYAHKKGIIHRDLKPSNIMFSKSEKCFKIIDFGVSAFTDTENHTKLTRTGEMIAGGSFIDPILQTNPCLRDKRTDIYSIGAIWYYLLTGQTPSGTNLKNRLMKSSRIDSEKADIILKCMEYNMDDRYDSCDQLLNIISTL